MESITEPTGNIVIVPANINAESRKSSKDNEKLSIRNERNKQSSGKAFANFLYNPRKRTVLGRDALNWGNLKDKIYD